MYITLTDDRGKAVLLNIEESALISEEDAGVFILHESGNKIHVKESIQEVAGMIAASGMRLVGHEKFLGDLDGEKND